MRTRIEKIKAIQNWEWRNERPVQTLSRLKYFKITEINNLIRQYNIDVEKELKEMEE
jgi:hypothetical protein